MSKTKVQAKSLAAKKTKTKKAKSKGKSPWTSIFFRRSDREISWCDLCGGEMEKGSMIFYFPQLKDRKSGSRRGTVYCFECFIKKVKMISVAEIL